MFDFIFILSLKYQHRFSTMSLLYNTYICISTFTNIFTINFNRNMFLNSTLRSACLKTKVLKLNSKLKLNINNLLF